MIRHLLKLVWNRKRTHGLLIFEIFVSFLVVFAVAAAAVYFGSNWLRPLGFDRSHVWVVQVGLESAGEGPFEERPAAVFEELLRNVRGLPEVAAAAGASAVPYDGSTTVSSSALEGGVPVEWHSSTVTDGFFDALGIRLVAGRGFAPEDDGLAWRPVIIDRDLARAWFGEEDPIGRSPRFEDSGEGDPAEREVRVVGLVDDYRKDGELAEVTAFQFERLDPADPRPNAFDNLVVRLAGPAPVGFEEQLLRRLQQLAPAWSFDIRSLDSMRERRVTAWLTTVVALGTIALSLLLMVALGMVGVMWQNVTQRTREIGLRRAAGASAGAIRRQVLFEMLLMAAAGVALGCAVLVQLPILGWFGDLNARTLALGFLVAATAMGGLTILCGIYPSRLATALEPAEALHHD